MANPPDSKDNKKNTNERNLAQPSSVSPPALKTTDPKTTGAGAGAASKTADPDRKLQTANLASSAKTTTPPPVPGKPATTAGNTTRSPVVEPAKATAPKDPPPIPTTRKPQQSAVNDKTTTSTPPVRKIPVEPVKTAQTGEAPTRGAATTRQQPPTTGERAPQRSVDDNKQSRNRPSRRLTRPDNAPERSPRSMERPPARGPRVQEPQGRQMPRRAGPPPAHPDRRTPRRPIDSAPRGARHFRSEPRRRMAPPAGAKPVGRFINRPRPTSAPPLLNAAPSNGSLGPLLIGILLLAGVGWLAVDHYTPRIQEDLLDRSRASLDAEGLGDTTDVSIDGRNITITGTVADEAMSTRAEELVGGTFGVRAVNNELRIGDAATSSALTTIDAPTLGMSSEGGKVTLSGAVSDEKFAQSIRDAAIAQYGEDNVIDELQIDANATNPGWTAAVNELQADLANVENSTLVIDDGKLTLTGIAQDEEQKEAIGTKAQALLAGQLEVDNQLEAPVAPAPSLPAFAAVKETDSQIILSGFMSEEGAQQIADAYQSSGKSVVNNISTNELADTPAWGTSFGDALSAMQSVTDGKLTVARSGNIRLQGTVETDEQKQTVGDEVAELFGDAAISNEIAVVPPPIVPSMTPFASIVQSPGKVMVSGLLPEEAAESLLESYRSTGNEVSDNIAIDERVMQPEWTDALAQSLGKLDGIENGAVSMTSSGEVIIRGEAENDDARTNAAQSVVSLFGDSVSLRNDISVKTPTIAEPPKPDVGELLSQIDLTGILFKSGSAELDGESVGILDQVVSVLSQHNDATILISGHTDSRGNADYNFNLSANRADAVQQYMINQGISASRLTARGYGPTQPIASNDTAAGRAQNRRIEIQLTGE